MLTIAPLLPAARDALLVVYAVDGESRNHAPVAAELRRVGYRQVRVLAGGLQGWIAVGGRVEGTAVRYHP
jgi:3-mercaptopyruvate sulfurtransferase SseA